MKKRHINLGLAIPIAAYVMLFLISRMPYFLHYFAVSYWGDFGSYAWEAQAILDYRWPDVSIRSPGYVVFLALVRVFTDSILALVIVQNLLVLVSGIILVVCLHSVMKHGALVGAVAAVGAHFGGQSLLYDTSLQADSLFAVFLTISFSLAARSIAKPDFPLRYAGLFAGLAILTRPAGLFLIVPLLLLFGLLVINRRTVGSALGVLAPVAVLCLVLSTYNFVRSDHFGVNAWGEANLAGATMIMWKTDEEYPDTVNEYILRVRGKFTEDERSIVTNSFDLDKLYGAFYRGFNVLSATGWNIEGFETSYDAHRTWLRRISLDAVRKSPQIYLKFFAVNFIRYFQNVRSNGAFFDDGFYGARLQQNADFMRGERKRGVETLNVLAGLGDSYILGENDVDRNYCREACGPEFDVERGLRVTSALQIYDAIDAAYSPAFRNIAWSYAFLVLFALTIFVALKNRGQMGKLELVAITGAAIVVSKATLVSMVEMALPRYSYPTLAIFYASTILMAVNLFLTSRGWWARLDER